jgi:outer membrane protein assembly factor BamE (lipoprotein component of BamABCDE complex)
MSRSVLSAFVVVFVVAFLLGGCGVSGTVIDPTAANLIQKGEVRSEVEKRFGEPNYEDSPEGGLCHVRYDYADSRGDLLSYVPYVQMFAGGQKMRAQSLCITYKDGVVQESKFSDTTTTTSGGIFNMQVRQKPTPGSLPPSASGSPGAGTALSQNGPERR